MTFDDLPWIHLDGAGAAGPPGGQPPVYHPYPVLSEYTDDGVRATCGPDQAALLLTVPAEYRQAVVVEVNRRTFRTVSSLGGEMLKQLIGDVDLTTRVVVGEVRAQLATTRTETPR